MSMQTTISNLATKHLTELFPVMKSRGTSGGPWVSCRGGQTPDIATFRKTCMSKQKIGTFGGGCATGNHGHIQLTCSLTRFNSLYLNRKTIILGQAQSDQMGYLP